jgi:hypothetical protein
MGMRPFDSIRDAEPDSPHARCDPSVRGLPPVRPSGHAGGRYSIDEEVEPAVPKVVRVRHLRWDRGPVFGGQDTADIVAGWLVGLADPTFDELVEVIRDRGSRWLRALHLQKRRVRCVPSISALLTQKGYPSHTRDLRSASSSPRMSRKEVPPDGTSARGTARAARRDSCWLDRRALESADYDEARLLAR